jgi:acetolactate synthase I/II/III large subunit
MWAAQNYRWRYPRTLVTSGGLGVSFPRIQYIRYLSRLMCHFFLLSQTMGFGLPAAIGAKVAAPKKTVVDIDGDASFSMTAMELATASQYDIGVKVLVLNNEFQGMVLQWQGTVFSCYCTTTYLPRYNQICSTMHVIRTPK